jgi:hypothetical protein
MIVGAVRAGAVLLAAALASTGFVALAAPAHALASTVTISSPSSPVTSNDRTPVVTFTGIGTQFECAADLESAASPTYVGCTSPWTVPSLPTDGAYTLAVRETGPSSGGAPATVTYTLDTVAPAATTVTGASGTSASTSPTWTWPNLEGDTALCTLTTPSGVGSEVPCTSPTSDTAVASAQGDYQLSVVLQDAAGNRSLAATGPVFTLDTSPAAAAAVVAPASPASGRQPVWTITGAEPGLTATCTVTGPTTPASDVDCSAPMSGATFTADLTGAPDGSYVLTVTVRDAAGNSTDATSAPYLLDTTAPAAAQVQAPASPGNDRVVTWTLTGDTDAVLQCRFNAVPSSTTSFATFSTCPGGSAGQGSFTADLTTATDGTYALTVRAQDAAGNLGPEVSSSYVLDTTPPAAPTSVQLGHASPSNATSVTWTFAGEADTTTLCTLLSATAVAVAEAPCTSPVTTDLSQLPDGVYSLSVRSKDVAGNLGPARSADYTLDRTAPSGPLFTTTPGSPSPVLSPVWGVQASDAGDTLECQLLGLPGSAWSPCTSPVSYDLSPATSGTYTLQVRETDRSGNRSEVVSAPPYVLDGNAPVPPIVTPPLHSPDDATAPVFHIAKGIGSEEVVSLRCTVTRFDGLTSTASPCAFGDSTVALTGVAAHAQGLVSLSVRGLDAAGNASGAATASYVYDDVPPAPAVIRPLASDTGTSPRVTWSFGEPGGAALLAEDSTSHLGTANVLFACELTNGRTAPSVTRSTRCSSPHTELLTQSGTWTLWVWAMDVAGNVAPPDSSSYTFMSRVPAVTDLRTPASGPSSHPTWTFTVPPGYTATCLLTNANNAVIAQAGCGSGSYTADLSSQPHGSFTLAVQLLDSRGDEGPFARSTPYAYRAASATGAVPVARQDSSPPLPTQPTTVAAQPVAGRPARTTSPAVSAAGSGKPAGAALGVRAPGAFITTEVPKAISNTLAQVARKPAIPLLLLTAVIGFLLLQNRIDRRDPKLASAPVGAEPELDFGPVQQLGHGLGGGAHA